MKKPHEQEWIESIHPYGTGTRASVRCNGRVVVHAPAFDPQSAAERATNVRFIAAAPAMARELLHLVHLLEPLEKEGDLDVPGLATLSGARKALRNAGVIP